MEPKKRRGRPTGSTLKGDLKLLHKMADLILKEPSLTPTTAIKRVVADWTETIVHRLRGKWKKQRETLLAAARERQDATAASGSSVSDNRMPTGLFDHFAAIDAARKLLDSPAVRLMREMQNHPLVKMQRLLDSNPNLKMLTMKTHPVFEMLKEQERLRRSLGL